MSLITTALNPSEPIFKPTVHVWGLNDACYYVVELGVYVVLEDIHDMTLYYRVICYRMTLDALGERIAKVVWDSADFEEVA